jgi:aldehyde:ferredoxin oxidoreductase
LIDDLAAVVHLGQVCDRLGLDTISCANTIGLAIHLFEQGVIGARDTGGLALRWNDPAGVEQLVTLTAHAEGFGALLAQGARALGAHFGAEEQAVQVNGLEAAFHDPRALSGMALVYATSPRGACHNQGDYYVVEIGGAHATLGLEFLDRFQTEGKAANVARHQDWTSVRNNAIVCLFANVPPEQVLELLVQATGAAYDLESLLRTGERAWTLKRLINHNLGLTRDGGTEGHVPDLARLLDEYYAVRGWEAESGRPAPATLARLGLDSLPAAARAGAA